MNILGFDTSGAVCAAAVLRDGRLAARRAEAMERGHAQALVPMLAEVMGEAELGFDTLDAVGVTIGPGAFTGIRIGLAAARGIGLAAGLPVFGVTAFEAIAAAIPDRELADATLLVAIESRREEIFVQLFDAARRSLEQPRSVPAEALAALVPPGPCLVAGDAMERAAAALGGRELRRAAAARTADPEIVARLAGERWRRGERPPPPSPFYLRAPDVTVARANP
jgi:tRNA threonylcarbamoyladenosine biosynthesis protein TsaB